MNDSFNCIAKVFIPNGEADPDEEVIVAPEDTRPIGLKNTFNKIICGAWGHAIKFSVSEHLHHSQRGMVPDRNFINNAVDLDTMGRVYGLMQDRSLLPIFAFFDIAAAYPSLSHAFLFLALQAFNLPQGALNVFKCMYHNVKAFGRHGGVKMFLFSILAGVIQGCPLSGLAFAIALDPFFAFS